MSVGPRSSVAVVALAALCSPSPSCSCSPTEVILIVSTDLPTSQIDGVRITATPELSRTFRFIGITVTRDSHGTVWMTQDFSN